MDFPQAPADWNIFLSRILAVLAVILLTVGFHSQIVHGNFALMFDNTNAADIDRVEEDVYFTSDVSDRQRSAISATFDVHLPRTTSNYHINLQIQGFLLQPQSPVTVVDDNGDELGTLANVSQVMYITIYREDGQLMNTTLIETDGDSGGRSRSSSLQVWMETWDGSLNWSPKEDQLIDEQKTSFYISYHVFQQYDIDSNRYYSYTNSSAIDWQFNDNEVYPIAKLQISSITGYEAIFTNRFYHHPSTLITAIFALAVTSVIIHRRVDADFIESPDKIDGDSRHGPFLAPWKRKVN